MRAAMYLRATTSTATRRLARVTPPISGIRITQPVTSGLAFDLEALTGGGAKARGEWNGRCELAVRRRSWRGTARA